MVLRLFRGMMQTVVNRIIKTEEPDFIVETHTATIGVHGSNPYFLLMPNFTSVYLPFGLLEVSSNNLTDSLQGYVEEYAIHPDSPWASNPSCPRP